MTEAMDTAAAEQLRSFVERIERLEEEKAALMADIKDVKSEAKAMGYDVKALALVVGLRKKSPQQLEEEEQLVALYRLAVGV